MIREIAHGYKWMSFSRVVWHKAKIGNANLGPFPAGAACWIRLNGELPQRGEALWVFGPNSKRLMQVSRPVLSEYINVSVKGGKPVAATAVEQKKIDDAFQPVLVELMEDRDRVRGIVNRLKNGNSSFQPRPRGKEIKPKQGLLF
jgi:hypothetical protein